MRIGRFYHKSANETFWGIAGSDDVGRVNDLGDLTIISRYDPEVLEVLTPVMPKKIIAVGLNYRRHAEEMKLSIPDDPVLFMKPHTAVLAHRGTIIYPEMSGRVDYEAELGIVISRDCRNIAPSEAASVILGYTAFNDVTARDLQSKDGQWTRAKGFDTFAPFGPYIETDLDTGALDIEAVLNGKTVQKSNTSDMIFDVYKIVSFISKVMTLEEGDVIATGTPEGIGPMQKGDEIIIRIQGLDDLVNFVG
ncbi:MAG: hypothetical protein A2Y33_04935 [Spirochaetes bacterium GWF1_51_8]|nr:MAG: hypothetical protein A2Y33_04935 [Spirochaetes bacterium GWF1_51_8]